jgi:hypothetical protein
MEIHKIQLGFQTVMGKNQLEITINHHYYSHVPNHQPGAMFLGTSRWIFWRSQETCPQVGGLEHGKIMVIYGDF